MTLHFTLEAWEEYRYRRSTNRKRINRPLRETPEVAYLDIGKPGAILPHLTRTEPPTLFAEPPAKVRTALIQSRQTLRISMSPQPKARALPKPVPSVARNVSGSSTDRIPLTSSKPNVTRPFPGLGNWRTE